MNRMKYVLVSIALWLYTGHGTCQGQDKKDFARFFLGSRTETYLQRENLLITESDINRLRQEYPLSAADSQYILRQRGFKYRKELLPGTMKLISKAEGSKKIKDNPNWDMLYLSAPIWIEEGKRMLIKAESHCGSLCGEGLLLVYERKDGGWLLVQTVLLWIS